MPVIVQIAVTDFFLPDRLHGGQCFLVDAELILQQLTICTVPVIRKIHILYLENLAARKVHQRPLRRRKGDCLRSTLQRIIAKERRSCARTWPGTGYQRLFQSNLLRNRKIHACQHQCLSRIHQIRIGRFLRRHLIRRRLLHQLPKSGWFADLIAIDPVGIQTAALLIL